MRIKMSKSEIAFDITNYTVLIILGVITLYPLLNVFAISFSSFKAYVNNPLMIIPNEISFDAYKRILTNPLIISCYKNTIFIAIVGTFFNLLMTVTTAYPLAKSKIKGDRYVLFFIIFTMLFHGGLIPTFLVVKSLKLLDSLWALILPMSISTYNFIIIKNFFESIPDSLEESAKIDGAGHLCILFKIVIPLSVPVLATVALFYGVSNWNRFFEAIIYLNDRNKWTLTLLLREIITENSGILNSQDPLEAQTVFPKTMQSATIIVAILPILFSYPFLQKYFIKGIMIGAVKG